MANRASQNAAKPQNSMPPAVLPARSWITPANLAGTTHLPETEIAACQRWVGQGWCQEGPWPQPGAPPARCAQPAPRAARPGHDEAIMTQHLIRAAAQAITAAVPAACTSYGDHASSSTRSRRCWPRCRPAGTCAAWSQPAGRQDAAASVSKSAVSRRFVAATETALAELMSRRLDDLDLSLHGQRSALRRAHLRGGAGIGIDGTKHPLGGGGLTEKTLVTDLITGCATAAWMSPSRSSPCWTGPRPCHGR